MRSKLYAAVLALVMLTTAHAATIVFPQAGASLYEGKEYTLVGQGTNLVWQYDANSDGLGKVDIGTGDSVKFTIPTDITGPKTITFFLTGDGSPAEITCNIVEYTGAPTVDAGGDKVLILPENSVTLNGSATDDGTITEYEWTKEQGGAAHLSGASTATLSVSGLVEGTYVFRLTVTDDDTNIVYDEASVYVYAKGDSTGKVSGELKKWHRVTVTFNGPVATEDGTPNPFTDYRLDVIFTNGSTTYKVPGYFAADGNAANTSATGGNTWKVHFAPDKIGAWNYVASFKTGTDIATSTASGSSGGFFDGATGSVTIGATDKTGRDFRGKGMLHYVGERYLQFAETGEYFLKQGADAPENLLAYDDFDNTPDNGGRRKAWAAHVADWKTGDPTWDSGKGKGLIGAINYLHSEGMNVFSFLPMNIGGDDKNVFPYISDNAADRTRIDCSKCDQWEIVFEHADKLGMFLHFKTLETENELLLDGSGDLGPERKLYYRELVARFGHHLALNWNLGEEINNASTAQKASWAQYFYDTDPYHHHIVIHNGANHYDLLGNASKLTGFSLQTNQTDFSNVHSRVLEYINRSVAAGKSWAVACDEPGDASHALRPDDDAGSSHVDGRKNGIWGTFTSGGWGNEWYFGYQHDHSDLTCQDWRSRDTWWDYCRIGLEFFTKHVRFWEMRNQDSLTAATNDYCFAQRGSVYVVYLPDGGTTNLTLETGNYDVQWYDPRHGGDLQNSTVTSLTGPGPKSIGNPPDSTSQDWAALVTHTGYSPIADHAYVKEEQRGLKLLQNPVRQLMELELPRGMDIRLAGIQVFDARGILHRVSAKCVQGILSLDVSGLEYGVYIIKLGDNKQDFRVKFLVSE